MINMFKEKILKMINGSYSEMVETINESKFFYKDYSMNPPRFFELEILNESNIDDDNFSMLIIRKFPERNEEELDYFYYFKEHNLLLRSSFYIINNSCTTRYLVHNLNRTPVIPRSLYNFETENEHVVMNDIKKVINEFNYYILNESKFRLFLKTSEFINKPNNTMKNIEKFLRRF